MSRYCKHGVIADMCNDAECCPLAAAKEKAEARRSAADCSQSVIGYRLEDGTDKMECFFLPGRPTQRTLDMVAEHLKAGWILTDVIRPANAQGHGRRTVAPNKSDD